MEFNREVLMQAFRAESDEMLAGMEQTLLALESAPENMELAREMFRVAHTLKGTALSLGLKGFGKFAHTLEDLLERVVARQLSVTPERIGFLLRAVDVMQGLTRGPGSDGEGLSAEAERVMEAMARSAQEDAAPAPAPGAPTSPEVAHESGAARSATLRVNTEKLDRMLNLCGEIGIARGALAAQLEAGASMEVLLEAHREADRLHLDLQELVMRARMVAVGPIFRQHLRTVRDGASQHGKQARLVLEGEDVEVDTSVVDHLREPLTHLVRNAVGHGIETPEERQAAGKEPVGTVQLCARHDGGNIVISVTDDGRGYLRGRIIEKAIQLGLVPLGTTLPDEEILDLVFTPGFSTADRADDLAGRGIGMDVVRRSIEALHGTLQIDSVEGQGSTTIIRLPLTMAIIQGFSIGVGSETYIIPLGAVVECLELPHLLGSGASGVINLRGEPLPFYRVRNLFDLDGVPPERESVVVVSWDGRKAGLAVDALYGESQTIIKPIGKLFKGLEGVSGTAVLASGRVALILDVPALFRNIHEHPGERDADHP